MKSNKTFQVYCKECEEFHNTKSDDIKFVNVEENQYGEDEMSFICLKSIVTQKSRVMAN